MTAPYRIFPQATETQRAEIKRSIEAVGLQNPLVVDGKKNVIDGHDRRDVCTELGIDWMAGADVRFGLTDDQKKALAIDLNMWRRPLHLTREKRNELIDVYLIGHPELSEPQVAELFGVDQSTINRRKKQLVQKHKLPPVQATVGKDGVRRKVGNRGARMTVKSEREYDSLVPDIAEVEDDLKGIIRRPNSVASTAKRKRALANLEDLVLSESSAEDSVRLYHCPFQKLESVAGLSPASVELIFTDIPYDDPFLDQLSELAELAKRLLVDGGLFVSYVGQRNLDRYMSEFGKHLTWGWQAGVTWSGPAPTHHPRQVRNRFSPLLVFSNGKWRDKGIWVDSHHVDGELQKDWHQWQKPLEDVRHWLRAFSNPGDLVVDVCAGSFTTAVACHYENRRFVGCDIEQHNVTAGQERLRLINKPSDYQESARSG